MDDDLRSKVEAIAAGEGAWTGSRAEAGQALARAADAIAARWPDAKVPDCTARPDWRRLPNKAAALLEVLVEREGASVALDDRLMARLRDGGGCTMAMLREATDASEPEVREALQRLRERYQPDNSEHPVSYKAKWWLARELSSLGHDLRLTARGTLKVVKTEGGSDEEAEAKPAYKAKSKGELLDEVRALLDGHPDAESVVLEVVTRIDSSFGARQAYKDVCAECRKAKEAAEVILREAVELGREKGRAAAEVKLDGIETAWQALQETLASNVERRKAARDDKRRADAALEQLMLNLRQLELPGIV